MAVVRNLGPPKPNESWQAHQKKWDFAAERMLGNMVGYADTKIHFARSKIPQNTTY